MRNNVFIGGKQAHLLHRIKKCNNTSGNNDTGPHFPNSMGRFTCPVTLRPGPCPISYSEKEFQAASTMQIAMSWVLAHTLSVAFGARCNQQRNFRDMQIFKYAPAQPRWPVEDREADTKDFKKLSEWQLYSLTTHCTSS